MGVVVDFQAEREARYKKPYWEELLDKPLLTPLEMAALEALTDEELERFYRARRRRRVERLRETGSRLRATKDTK